MILWVAPLVLAALGLLCVLIVVRPRWFASWTIVHRSGGDLTGARTRLGDLSTGTIRALYSVVAIILLAGAWALHDWARTDAICDQAREIERSSSSARAALAAEHGWTVREEKDGSVTRVVLQEADGRPIAVWTTGAYSRFECTA